MDICEYLQLMRGIAAEAALAAQEALRDGRPGDAGALIRASGSAMRTAIACEKERASADLPEELPSDPREAKSAITAATWARAKAGSVAATRELATLLPKPSVKIDLSLPGDD